MYVCCVQGGIYIHGIGIEFMHEKVIRIRLPTRSSFSTKHLNNAEHSRVDQNTRRIDQNTQRHNAEHSTITENSSRASHVLSRPQYISTLCLDGEPEENCGGKHDTCGTHSTDTSSDLVVGSVTVGCR